MESDRNGLEVLARADRERADPVVHGAPGRSRDRGEGLGRRTRRRPRRLAAMEWTVHGERSIYESDWVNLKLVDVEVPGLDFQASEEFSTELVGELGELDEVAAVAGHVVGDFGDDAGLVGAAELEN